MIIVTGGSGFIGSNLVRALNQRGENNILIVDHLLNGRKVHNIADLNIADYMDKKSLLNALIRRIFGGASLRYFTKVHVRQPRNGMGNM